MIARDTIHTAESTHTPQQLPTDFLPLLRQFNESFCNTTITPACLQQIYNIGDFTADLRENSLIGISSYDEEGLYVADIGDFQ